jgi:hypothetical protein
MCCVCFKMKCFCSVLLRYTSQCKIHCFFGRGMCWGLNPALYPCRFTYFKGTFCWVLTIMFGCKTPFCRKTFFTQPYHVGFFVRNTKNWRSSWTARPQKVQEPGWCRQRWVDVELNHRTLELLGISCYLSCDSNTWARKSDWTCLPVAKSSTNRLGEWDSSLKDGLLVKNDICCAWWCTSIIPDTQEVEAGGSPVCG